MCARIRDYLWHKRELNGSSLRLERRARMRSTPDEVLIRRIANGDPLAMQVLYARYHVRVFRFAVRLVRDEATAEDVISEVFLDVWRQAGRFEGRSMVSTWLLAIARSRPFRRSSVGGTRNWTKRPQPRSKICRTIPQLRLRRRARVQCCESASQNFRRNIGRSSIWYTTTRNRSKRQLRSLAFQRTRSRRACSTRASGWRSCLSWRE